MRLAMLVNAALITLWGVTIARMLRRRLLELARRQQDLLRRLDAIHRATLLGLASIRAAVRAATRDLPPADGGTVATMVASAGGRRSGGPCGEHDALRRWATARARRPSRRPATGGRARGRPPRLRP